MPFLFTVAVMVKEYVFPEDTPLVDFEKVNREPVADKPLHVLTTLPLLSLKTTLPFVILVVPLFPVIEASQYALSLVNVNLTTIVFVLTY